MSDDIINKHTEEKIKDYLSEEKVNKFQSSVSDNFGVAKKNEKREYSKKIFFVVFAFIIIAFCLFYFMRNQGKQSFDESQVKVKIEVAKEVMSGEELAFNINYANNTSVDLKNVKINFYIPKHFIYISSERDNKVEESVISWNIENILAGKSGNIKLFGRILGDKNSEYDFKSKISYIPENFNYEFNSSDGLSDIKIIIKKVPFDLSIQSPETLTVGDSFEYVIDYENITNYDFKSLNIKSNFSENFVCSSENDNIASENEKSLLIFNIKDFEANATGKILIDCVVTASLQNQDENKIVTMLEASEDGEKYFEYAKEEISVFVKEIPIEIQQSVNGSTEYFAFKGEDLEYVIKFKNIGDEEIRGLVINSELSGKIDLDSIDVINGSYDKKSNKITWSAFNVPKLASFSPGDEGEVSFRANVADYIEIKNPEDKHFLINNQVTISNFNFDSNSVSVEKKIVSNNNITKLNASLFIRSKGYFNDDGRIKTSGAIPPEVDKETNYLIHWNLSSLFNDISSVKVISVLPDYVNWTGNFITSDGKISFGNEENGAFTPDEENELVEENVDVVENAEAESEEEIDILKEEKFYYNTKTREVIWEIPMLNANTGVVSPVKEVVFQIKINPIDSDVGNVLKIVNEVKATGYDDFTNKEIEAIDIALTSELPDDYSIGVNEGIVIANSDKEDL